MSHRVFERASAWTVPGHVHLEKGPGDARTYRALRAGGPVVDKGEIAEVAGPQGLSIRIPMVRDYRLVCSHNSHRVSELVRSSRLVCIELFLQDCRYPCCR